MTPTWTELLQRIGWLAYGWIRCHRKAFRRRRVARRQAKRIKIGGTLNYPRWKPGEPIMISDVSVMQIMKGDELRNIAGTGMDFSQIAGLANALGAGRGERAEQRRIHDILRQQAFDAARWDWERSQNQADVNRTWYPPHDAPPS